MPKKPFHSRLLRAKVRARQWTEKAFPELKRKRLAWHQTFFRIVQRLKEQESVSTTQIKSRLESGILKRACWSIERRLVMKKPPVLSERENDRIRIAIKVLDADLQEAEPETRQAARDRSWMKRNADRHPNNPLFAEGEKKAQQNLEYWVYKRRKVRGLLAFLSRGLIEFGE